MNAKMKEWLKKEIARYELQKAKYQALVDTDKATKKRWFSKQHRIHYSCLVATCGQLTSLKRSLDFLTTHPEKPVRCKRCESRPKNWDGTEMTAGDWARDFYTR